MQPIEERYRAAKALIKEGSTVSEACKRAGIASSQFYAQRNATAKPGPNTGKRRYTKRKPFVIEAPQPLPTSLAVAFGKPSEVAELIRRMQLQ